MTLLDLIRDAIARLVAIQESFEYGDSGTACAMAHDLEVDLVGGLANLGDSEPRFRLSDFNTVPSYGDGDPRIEAWCRAYLDDVA